MGPRFQFTPSIWPTTLVRPHDVQHFLDQDGDAQRPSPEAPYANLLGLLTHCSADLISVQDATGEYVYVSGNCAELFGWSTQDLLGRPAEEFAHANDVPALRKWLAALEHGRSRRVKYRLRCRSNRYRWVETRSRLSTDGRFILGMTRDIHQQVRRIRKLKREAYLDPLTTLHNRRSLGSHLAAEIERSRRCACTLSVAFIDCDRFKLINDTYGHDNGDETLRGIGRCIKQAKRSYDIAGRWGGDEFLLVFPGTAADAAATVATRIRELVAAAASAVTLSAGISSTAHAGSMEQLLVQADTALYEAKRLGGDRVVAWDHTASFNLRGN